MKKKLMLILPVLLATVGGAAYMLVLKPKPALAKPKIAGAVVPLEKEFVLNLSAGHYAKVSVAVVVAGAAGGGHGAGGLTQEAAIRAVITDELTGLGSEQLIERHGRHELAERILKSLHKTTDEHVEEVLFTDITVQ